MQRILIIDDSPEDREFMRRLLTDSGRRFLVEEAETGAAGLRACLENAEGLPDCILLDYHLPDYDAVGLLAALGGPGAPCCPVVVMTGSTDTAYDPAILQLDALDFIGKGWMNTVSLTRCVEKAIERFGMTNSLHHSEERARRYAEEMESLMDSAPIAIFISRDPECRVITGNRMANRLYENEPGENFSPPPPRGEQPMPRRFFRNGRELNPEDLPMQTAAAQGVEILDAELEVRSPGGNTRYCLNNARPLFDQNGKVRGSIAAVLDITERKRMEQALRERESLLRAYCESSPVLMGIVELGNDDVQHIYDNPAACEFFDLEPGATADRWASTLGVPSEVMDVWIEKYRESLRLGKPVRFELPHFFPGLPLRWLHITVTALPRTPPEPQRYCYICLDISSHKQLEERLQQANDELESRVKARTSELEQANQRLSASEARFRWLFDCDMIGIGYWRMDGAILDANDALLQLLGYGREEITSGRLNWRSITPPESSAADEAALKELAERGLVTPFEKEYLHQDGRRIPVMVGAATNSDQMDQGVFFVVDLTERKQAEEQVRRMSVELTLAEERERKAIARELHDGLGQILHLLKVKLDPLLAGEPEDERYRLLCQLDSLIAEASEKTRTLIAQLSPPALALGLTPALAWLAEEMERRYGVLVEMENTGIHLPLSSAQSAILFRAVRELLINVAKHSGVDRAAVAICADTDSLTITVADSGVGIANVKEALSGARNYGLVSVLESMSYLGGSLELQPPPAGGTLARLRLPFTTANPTRG